jgi:hypothetical protein
MERAPDTHWIGGWVGPRTGLDAVVKRKICSPSWDSKPPSSTRSPALYHSDDDDDLEILVVALGILRLTFSNKMF